MSSLGYLLLFSLAVTLISPTLGSGYYRRPSCPQSVSCCQSLVKCKSDNDCGLSQSCCNSGCGQRCFGGICNFFEKLFNCGGCAGSSRGRCSGGSCGGCPGGRCGYGKK